MQWYIICIMREKTFRTRRYMCNWTLSEKLPWKNVGNFLKGRELKKKKKVSEKECVARRGLDNTWAKKQRQQRNCVMCLWDLIQFSMDEILVQLCECECLCVWKGEWMRINGCLLEKSWRGKPDYVWDSANHSSGLLQDGMEGWEPRQKDQIGD